MPGIVFPFRPPKEPEGAATPTAVPLGYPPQDLYPSAKARLIVRFEEFTSETLKNQAPVNTSKNLKGLGGTRNDLRVVRKSPTGSDVPPGPPGTTPDGTTFVIEAKQGSAVQPTQGTGSSQVTSQDDLTHEIGGVIPKSADWKQNGLRTADTLSMTIKWADMPVDPRVVRSCAVEFYLGTVTAEQYARGVRGESREAVSPSGRARGAEPLNLVPDVYADYRGDIRTTLRFQGWVDKWEMTWNDGEPLVKLECRDNTQLFLDQQAPADLKIGGAKSASAAKPIDEAVAEYLSNFPQMAGVSVEYRPDVRKLTGKDPPSLKGALANTSFVPNLGPPASKGGGAAGGEGLTVWDYITDVCGALGLAVRIDGTRVIIQEVRSIMDSRASPRAEDPYRPRSIGGVEFKKRAMVFGRNISDLVVSREYSRKQPKNIEVRNYVPRRKNVMVARFPEQKDKQITHGNPGDGATDKKWTVFRVSGLDDTEEGRAALKKIAENVHNNIGRHELSVKVKTKDLSSFGGGNADPDLLDMRPGDDFELAVDRSHGSSVQTEAERKMSAQALNEEFLGALGYSDGFAKAYARAYTSAHFQRVFRLKEMGISWSTDAGVGIEMTGVNYIEARVDKPTEPSETATAPK